MRTFFLTERYQRYPIPDRKANLRLDGGAGKPVHAGGGPDVDPFYRERPGAEAQAAAALRVLRFAGQGPVLEVQGKARDNPTCNLLDLRSGNSYPAKCHGSGTRL